MSKGYIVPDVNTFPPPPEPTPAPTPNVGIIGQPIDHAIDAGMAHVAELRAALAAKDREIARLSEQVRDLDALRLCHGIELSSDPAPVGEDAACAEIHRLWRDEHCMAARGVLVRYSVTHDNLNRTMAILMVRAANQALQKERERADKLVRETENLRCKVLDQQDALNNLPDPAGVVALQARAEKAEAKVQAQAERIRYLEGATNHATGTPLSKAKAERDALRAEVDRLKTENQGMLNAGGYAYLSQQRDEAERRAAQYLATGEAIQKQLAAAQATAREAMEDKERLLNAAETAVVVLENMAAEHPEHKYNPFYSRWRINHEPLRNDAKNIAPTLRAAIDAALRPQP